jgi:homoserine O-acetyltransferase
MRELEKAAVPESLVTAEGDCVLNDFHFADGESLPELTLHYRTIGLPTHNPST